MKVIFLTTERVLLKGRSLGPEVSVKITYMFAA